MSELLSSLGRAHIGNGLIYIRTAGVRFCGAGGFASNGKFGAIVANAVANDPCAPCGSYNDIPYWGGISVPRLPISTLIFAATSWSRSFCAVIAASISSTRRTTIWAIWAACKAAISGAISWSVSILGPYFFSNSSRAWRSFSSSIWAAMVLALAVSAAAPASAKSRLSAASFTLPDTTIPYVAITPTTSAPIKSQFDQYEINSAHGSDIPVPLSFLVLLPIVILTAGLGVWVMGYLIVLRRRKDGRE